MAFSTYTPVTLRIDIGDFSISKIENLLFSIQEIYLLLGMSGNFNKKSEKLGNVL